MNAEQIIVRVALVFEVEPRDLIISLDMPKYREARQAAAYVMRNRCDLSYTAIAAVLGYRDHSSVRYAILGATSKIRTRQDYRDKIAQIGAMS